MRCNCYTNDLVEAMQILIYSVAVKPMTQSLAGIYLVTREKSLVMQANNFTIGASVEIPAEVISQGSVLVVGKKFQDFVRNMPEDTITLFGEEAAPTFSLESGSAHVDLLTMPVSEFTDVKDLKNHTNKFDIRSAALKNMIRKTVFAVAKDNDRPIFKGCCFELKGNLLNLFATNAQRIAFVTEEVKNDTENSNALFVLPTDALRCLMQTLDPNDMDRPVEIAYSNKVVAFKFNNVYITSRILDGEFPSYDKAFATDYMTTVVVEKAELRQAVDLIAPSARAAEFNAIRFDIMPGQIKISASSPDVGDARKTIEAELFGDPMEIAFNVNYIIDVLRVLDTKRVCIKLGTRVEPVLFCEENNKNYSYVLTPVRF